MQLESHATPPKETPQQRYATLHRAVERGLDSDEVWRELAEVSLRLGHGDEAVACLRRIRNPALHAALESRLVRLGLIEDPAARNALSRRHPRAPAAGHAGGGEGHGRSDTPGLGEHVLDAFQYLCHQHMPWLVVVTTLAFPFVVGLGGFLTAGGSPLVLAAIAAVPGLSVLAVVGAMGRQILLASSSGSADVPNLPELGQLLRDARTFLVDAGIVFGSLLAPTIGAMALGAPLSTTLPGLLVGALFTPLAWALRQTRGDFGALSPVTLLRALARSGRRYLGLVPVCWLLFAPAALTAWAVFGRPAWVQIAAIGPLAVAPLFVVSRLLGTWLDTMRHELGGLLVAGRPRSRTKAGTEPAAAASKPAAASDPQPERPRLPRRPEALEHFRAPNVKPPTATGKPGRPAAAARPTARPTAARPATAPASGAARPAPGAPASRASGVPPASKASAAPKAPAAPPAPAPAAPRSPAGKAPAARQIEGRGPRRAGLDDTPDLSQMPGAVVVSGQERARQGAAARPRR
ncbi:MAG: hypothetical protein KF830_05945 [Planctomycetes bacterium]|nr:hypothetical protein [Planctomycetota bacterium]